MKYCTECGNKNNDNHAFCMKCGAELGKKIPAYGEQQSYPTQKKVVLVRRNYLIWWLLSIVVSPIYLLYLYFNFEDMNNLETVRPSKEGPSMYVDKDQLILYIILSAIIPIFMIVVRHWKYDKFYNYLKYQSPKQETQPISGKKHLNLIIWTLVLGFLSVVFFGLLAIPVIFMSWTLMGIFIGLGTICAIAPVVIGFYLIYADYKWQQAMNERILIIDPQAEEKTLF